MMTQSVMTQAANLFGNAVGSVTSKGKQAGSGFDLMMDSSLKAAQNTSGTSQDYTTAKTSRQETQANQNSDDAHQTKEPTDAGQADNTTKTETSQKTEQDQSIDTKATQGNTGKAESSENSADTEELTVNDQVIAQIAEMLQNIRNVVMEVLNLTPEGLDQLLNDQGLSSVDLLQTENLQQLALAGNGQENILAALTDENLADTINQLLQSVDGIKAEANIALTDDQMKAILLQAEPQMIETTVVTTAQNEPVVVENEPSVQVEAVNTLKDSVNEDANSVKLDTETDLQTGTASVLKAEESDTGSQAQTSSEDNQDINASDQFQNFIDNLVKASTETRTDFSGNLEQVTELRNIASQIIERIKVSIAPDQTSMELQLNPENLGKVNLSVQSKDGVMTAQFVVQNELSKEAIEGQLNTLRETLNQQGIKVEAIEVTVSTYSFEQNGREASEDQTGAKKNNSGKQITLDEALNMAENPEEESGTEDITGIRGSRIDYTA